MTLGSAAHPRRRRVLGSVAVAFLAVIAFMSWGLSSPVGSSPDDDFHLASIWCGHGVSDGCAPASEGDERIVYRDLTVDSVCFAFNADASAACQGSDFGDHPEDVVTTPRGNFTGLYPPVFYFVMSLFTSANIDASVLVMKLVNSVLFVGLAAALFWLLPAPRRPTLLVALAVTLVPLGMFLVPSTNPSSWAILSAGTLWLALLGAFESGGKRRLGLGAIAVTATIIGAGARADAALYSGFAVALVLLMTFRRTRAYALFALFSIGLGAIAAVFYLTSHQGDAAANGLAPGAPGVGIDTVSLAVANLIHIPALWAGVFGSWNLGWLDTALPPSVWVAGLACFSAVIFLGLGVRVPRKGVAIAAIAVVLVVLPTVLLVQSNSMVGANFQPRYLLPLMIMLAGFVLLPAPGSPIAVVATQRWVAIVALSLANAVALHTNIRRYVTGADVPSVNLDANAEWWWQLPVSPMFIWIVGSLAFAAVLVGINVELRGARRSVDLTTPRTL